MSAEIKAGDLVAVVGGHSCMLAEIGGMHFTVIAIIPDVPLDCHKCKARVIYDGTIVRVRAGFHDYWLARTWVIKIDPPALPTETQADEGVSA